MMPTPEQVAQQRSELTKQATIGELMRRAASCEANMLDLQILKARVAELEAIEKKAAEMKKPSAESAIKP
jgi:hypothetical protein